MTQPSLLDAPPVRTAADTSIEAYARVRPTLAQREFTILLGLYDYLQTTGYADCTGGELAEFLHSLPTSTRPRLTGLCAKGYVEAAPTRRSRAQYESFCHPYRPTMPRAAVERAMHAGLKARQ